MIALTQSILMKMSPWGKVWCSADGKKFEKDVSVCAASSISLQESLAKVIV
jgi:hypothetical protein